MISLTWAALKDIVTWGQQATAAANKKSEQRCARIVEHSAVLVSGVTTLNRQLSSLLRPLVHFDPREWEQNRRTEHVSALIEFTTGETIVPQMRTSRSALRSLLVDSNDADLVRSAGNILRMADDLFGDPEQVAKAVHGARDAAERALWMAEGVPSGPRGSLIGLSVAARESPFSETDPEDFSEDVRGLVTSATLVLQDSFPDDELFGDQVMESQLPALLEYLRAIPIGELTGGQVGQSEVRDLQQHRIRTLAEEMLNPKLRPHQGHLPYEEDESSSPAQWNGALFPWAKELQSELGELLAAGQRSFPGLPTPSWEV